MEWMLRDHIRGSCAFLNSLITTSSGLVKFDLSIKMDTLEKKKPQTSKNQRFVSWRFWLNCVLGRLLLRALRLWLISFLLLWFTNEYLWSNICLVLFSGFLFVSLHHCFQSDSSSAEKSNLKCWQMSWTQLKTWFIWRFCYLKEGHIFSWYYGEIALCLWESQVQVMVIAYFH